ncbi:hypothetical protein AAHA92_15742 [Salvia divinorum]|uniref:G-patch domain-containing protein n=1 Tax=Salvia divinorum TaxID=28513 RepID=A0ABD1FQ56_SALDI
MAGVTKVMIIWVTSPSSYHQRLLNLPQKSFFLLYKLRSHSVLVVNLCLSLHKSLYPEFHKNWNAWVLQDQSNIGFKLLKQMGYSPGSARKVRGGLNQFL